MQHPFRALIRKMLQLDLMTLGVTLALVSVSSVLVLFIFWRINQKLPGVGHWAIGGCFIAMAFLSIFLATMLDAPPDLGPFLSHSMSLPGVLFTLEGCLRFRGFFSERRWRVMLLMMPVLVLIAWVNKDNPQARYLFHDAFAFIGMFAVGTILCWRPANRFELQANALAAASAVLIGAAFLVRWQHALVAPDVSELGLNMVPNHAVFLALILFSIGWTYGLGVACYFRSNQQVMQLAREDVLTGLPNRRFIDETLSKTLLESRRSGRAFAVLMIDINGFKQVNDKLGHSSGDLLLSALAQRLRDAVRDADFAGRLGGDEFLVLARGVDDEQDAAGLISRLRAGLNGPLQIEGRCIDAAVSIGLAVWPGDGDSKDALLRVADLQMYRDKSDVAPDYSPLARDVPDLVRV